MKAVLFDFGGTLDTDGVHWSEKFWDVYQQVGVHVSKQDFEKAYVAAERGMSKGVVASEDSFRTTLQKQVTLQFEALKESGFSGKQESTAVLSRLVADRCFVDVLKIIDRIRPVLESCKRKYPLGIVSNFYGNLAAACRELHIDSLFNVMVDSEVVGARKPDPEIFLAAIRQLGVSPADTLVLGDSYSRDIVPAKSLGCTTVWLRGKSWTTPAGTEDADYVVYSIETIRCFLTNARKAVTP